MVLLAGCELLGPDEPSLRVETERSIFEVGVDTSFVVTVTNVGEETVYYSECLDVQLTKLRGRREVESSAPVRCECICLAELGPQEVVQFDMGPWMSDLVGRLHHEVDADYRFRFGFYADERLQRPLPEVAQTSNRFDIVTPLRAWTEAGRLLLENRLSRSLAYVALEAETATLVDLAPASQWPTLGAGERVALPYDSLMGFDRGDEQAAVYWTDRRELWGTLWVDLD